MIAYLAALAPIIFGTTYLLTSDFLPPGRPLLAALLRSLPTGLILIIGTRLPDRRWLARLAVLSVLYASGLFPLLFLAAYLLPGGVAAVINSISPLLVVALSVPLLGAKIQPVQVGAGVLGIGGVALLVLRSDARLDPLGLLAMTGAALMMGTATVLTKRWGRPPGMTAVGMTGWTFLLAGLTLLPITLLAEGLPDQLTGRNLGGLVYLVLISGVLAYALWFWGLQYLTASSVTFLSLLNPVVAAVLGWVVLDQRLNGWQLLGAFVVLASVVLGQQATLDRLGRRRRADSIALVSGTDPGPALAAAGVRGGQRARPTLHLRQRAHLPGLDPYGAGVPRRRSRDRRGGPAGRTRGPGDPARLDRADRLRAGLRRPRLPALDGQRAGDAAG